MGIILGYWDIRGLAHAIRLLLEHTGTSYEDKQYSCGEGKETCLWNIVLPSQPFKGGCCDAHGHQVGNARLMVWGKLAPDFDTSAWTNVKNNLGLDFPNLPYLIDGETKITQSNAILRYIARKHNMCGESEEEIIRMDMLENQVMDFRLSFARICYSPDFEKLKPEFLEQLPAKLKLFSQFLGNRKWFAGDKLTYVDFLAYDILDQQRMFEPKCLDQFTNLKGFLDRFEALENISAYMKSSRFMKTPVFWRIAKWCNKKE